MTNAPATISIFPPLPALALARIALELRMTKSGSILTLPPSDSSVTPAASALITALSSRTIRPASMTIFPPAEISASPALAKRILAAAPKPVPENQTTTASRGRRPFLESLWPFGPVWRPAMALAGAALLGVIFGYSVPAPIDTDFAFEVASIDEVVEFAVGFDQRLEFIE